MVSELGGSKKFDFHFICCQIFIHVYCCVGDYCQIVIANSQLMVMAKNVYV